MVCSYFGDPRRECSCTPLEIQKHLNKVSGPLLDRIDIHIQVAAVRKEEGFKISRTVAHLGEKEIINSSDVSEALQYRYLDRDLWRR